MRSWGDELWDQWDAISSHSQKSIDFLDTYKQFIAERIRIETDYAKSLRKLVKSYTPKKKDENDKFSVVAAFRESVKETGDMAGQHELIAEDMGTQIVSKLHDLIKEFKEDRKKNLSDGGRLQHQLTHSYQQLEKAKKNYEKSFREAEKAQDNYQKADADLNLSRAEVEKQRMNLSIKSQNSEDYKNEYANQLQKTNTIQSDHYSKYLPNLMQNFQDIDINRIKSFKSLLIRSSEIEKSVYPIILKCLDGVVKAANSINEIADSEAVIEKYKSGFTPPEDIPFDDLSNSSRFHNGSEGDSNSLPGHTTSTPTSNSHPPFRSETIKGTISAAKFRKRANLFTGIFGSNKDEFNDLPPNQRKKKIQHKIDEVTTKLNQECSTRDALLKMKEVYEGNPSLGDPMTITGQLSDSCANIDKLREELDKFKHMLDNPNQSSATLSVTSSPTPPSRMHHNGGSNTASSPRSSVASHRTSISDESISRSASNSSLHNTTTPPQNTSSIPQAPPPPSHLITTPPSSQGSSHSPESGISLSHNSLHGSEQNGAAPQLSVNQSSLHHGADSDATMVDGAVNNSSHDDSSEFYDLDPLPIIGSCRALYSFDGTSEGSMALKEGETLSVIEVDAGDGWTRVRRLPPDNTEGFVPTTYIQVSISEC